MGAAENKAVIRRIFDEGMDEQRVEVFDDCLAGTFTNHDMPAPLPGPEGFRRVFGMFPAAFPDMPVGLDETSQPRTTR